MAPTATELTSRDRATRVNDVRDLVADALRAYAGTPEGAARVASGVSADDLAADVRSWTHLTRLDDFIVSRAGATD